MIILELYTHKPLAESGAPHIRLGRVALHPGSILEIKQSDELAALGLVRIMLQRGESYIVKADLDKLASQVAMSQAELKIVSFNSLEYYNDKLCRSHPPK